METDSFRDHIETLLDENWDDAMRVLNQACLDAGVPPTGQRTPLEFAAFSSGFVRGYHEGRKEES